MKVEASAFAKVAGIGVIGFALVILVANVFLASAGMPAPGAGAGEAYVFFGEPRPVIGLTSMFMPAAWALSTVFAAGAASVLWRSDRDRGEAWSLVGFAGVVMQNAVFLGVIAIRLALASASATDEAVVEVLWLLQDALIALNGAFLAAALVGFSISGLRAGLLRRWHCWVGLLSAGLLFCGASIAPFVLEHGGLAGFVGLGGWLLWVCWLISYGVALLRLESAASGRTAVGQDGSHGP